MKKMSWNKSSSNSYEETVNFKSILHFLHITSEQSMQNTAIVLSMIEDGNTVHRSTEISQRLTKMIADLT